MDLLNSLKELAVEGESIPELIARIADDSPGVTEVDLSYKGLSQKQIDNLSHALANNHHVKTLNLNGNDLNDDMIKSLWNTGLVTNSTVTSVDLGFNKLTAKTIKEIKKTKVSNPKSALKEITLFGNDKITQEEEMELFGILNAALETTIPLSPKAGSGSAEPLSPSTKKHRKSKTKEKEKEKDKEKEKEKEKDKKKAKKEGSKEGTKENNKKLMRRSTTRSKNENSMNSEYNNSDFSRSLSLSTTYDNTNKGSTSPLSSSRSEKTEELNEETLSQIRLNLMEKKLKEMENRESELLEKIEELQRALVQQARQKSEKSTSVNNSNPSSGSASSGSTIAGSQILSKRETKSSLLGSLLKKNRSNLLTIEPKNIVVAEKIADAGGSNAAVYSCYIDGWQCAMKELQLSANSEYSINSFEGEIRMLELLPSHPNIVKYLHHERTDDKVQLFMTKYAGSLGSVVRNRQEKFGVSEIVRYAFDIAKGLSFLHSNGIVHRDLKCDNIFVLLDERKEIKTLALGDFDTAKKLDGNVISKTVVGTPSWMAPEILSSTNPATAGYYSYAVDVYSFGMILYELLTLKVPYYDVSPFQVYDRITKGIPPTLPKFDEDYQPLVELHQRCIAFSPSKRPLTNQLKEFLALCEPKY